MTTFALVGGNGYIGRRHAEAIKAVGGEVIAVVDPHDCAGWLDGLGFTKAELFPEILSERTWKLADWRDPDYMVILTPNQHHYHHAVMALEHGCDVIVEKPLALTGKHIVKLTRRMRETDRTVSTILQLRYQAGALAAGQAVDAAFQAGRPPVRASITYFAHRGAWYVQSWKGDPKRSGGIIFNIGSHPVDLACRIFGRPLLEAEVIECVKPHHLTIVGMFGETEVTFHLSTASLPVTRALDIEGVGTFDLSDSFTNLHIKCYRQIIAGRGPFPDSVKDCLRWCEVVAKEVGL